MTCVHMKISDGAISKGKRLKEAAKGPRVSPASLKSLGSQITKISRALSQRELSKRVGDGGVRLVYEEWRKVVGEFQKVYVQTEQCLFAIHSVLIGLSLDGRITYWNRTAETLFGVGAQRVLNQSLFRCGVRWDAGIIRRGIEYCRASRKPLRLEDIRYSLSTGRKGIVGFTVNPTRNEQGNLSGFLLIGADVTEHRLIEDQVRKKTSDLENAKNRIEREKAKDAAILASIGEALVGTDSSGRITVLNEEAENMFGWRLKHVAGKRIADLLRLEDEGEREIRRENRPVSSVLSTGKKVFTTAYCVLRDKSRLPCAITASPVNFGGKMIGVIMIARDISKEKEADKMKNEFISTVSHELRTPLTVIKEGVSLILEDVVGTTSVEQKKFLSMTLENIDRLKRIIDDVLDMSKIEAGKFQLKKENVNLAELIQKVSTAFYPQTERAGLKLKTRCQKNVIPVFADQDKVFQIVTNLVSNALKYTKKGYIEITACERDTHAECSVVDTGKGIYQKDLRKVFDKFQQCGRLVGPGVQGTGLGLAIAKGFVDLHGGKIWVKSRLNKGSKFTFTLPKN